MTAQIGDIYKYKNERYTLVAVSGVIPFLPEDYGIEPQAAITACWRGYWCEYAIDDTLTLDELYLHNSEGHYPPINGVDVSEQEFEELTVYSKGSEKREMFPKYNGHRRYRNIGLPIPYTGKILVGKDFIHKYYIHMGFQRYWAYKKLIEFEFDEGLLVEVRDCSELAEKKRAEMEGKGSNPYSLDNGAMSAHVEDCFSLDY